MSDEMPSKKDNVFRPSNIDDELQRELDAALGDMSLEQLIAAEETSASAAVPPGTKTAGVRKGRVISVQGDDLFVDLGGKSQGILPAAQFEDEPLPQEGDWVEVTIEGYDQAEGLLMLSRKGAVLAAAWETLAEGQNVEARVTGHNKGGLEVAVGGMQAFIPISHIELFRVEDLAPYVGRKLTCQVLEVNQEDRKVVLSRRAVLEFEAQKAREEMYEKLQEGQIVKGVVRNIMPYGAFVNIGGADGLLHVSDMAHTRVEDPKTVVQEGQTIDVKILKIDRENRRISLGLKQVMPDPWTDVEKKWQAETVVAGRVTRLADFGAFVELEPGVEALVPIGEITFERRLKHPSELLKTGDVVKARVMSIDPTRKRISLSIKRAGNDPWMGASARWPVNSVVEGIVKRTADFGAFIELTPGVEGLAHISELSYEHVRTVGDAVKDGQVVKAKVLEVDEDRRRISLSVKQAGSSVEQAMEAPASAETPAPVERKRKKPLKGGLD
jgi:small subunit ribosomal protein S1